MDENMQYRVAWEIQWILHTIKERLRGSSDPRTVLGMLDETRLIHELIENRDFQDEGIQKTVGIQSIFSMIKQCNNLHNVMDALEKAEQMLMQETKRLKIAFIVQEFALWPSFQSIWEACEDDVDKDIVFVYTREKPLTDQETERFVEPYRKAGYAVKTMKEYSLQEEQPDIVFYQKPYYGFRGCPSPYYVTDANKLTPYTVFVSYCLDVQGGRELERYFYGLPFFYHVWKIIGYSEYYRSKMIQKGYRNAENVVLLGHPKFDVAYSLARGRQYFNPKWQDKIRGRVVVLWNTHFSVAPGTGVGTFLKWKDTVFDYFSKHQDIVLLWRPHPLFWESVVEYLGMSQAEFNVFVQKIAAEDNVIVDKGSDYRYAFCMSNALISDAATFLVEYAASANPILYTVKKDGEQVCNPDYLDGIRIAEETEDMLEFLDDIRLGRISKEECQKNFEMFERTFGKCDGMVGKRILQNVMDEMEKDIKRRAQDTYRLLETGDKHAVER